MGFGLHSVAPIPLTLSQLSTILPSGTVAKITDFGGTIAISDGVRWRLERLYLAWDSLPSASLVPVGTEASVSDCSGAIAVAGVAGWVFRPIEILNSSTPVLINGSTGSADQIGYQFTLPANLMGTKGIIAVETFGTFSVASVNSKILKLKLASSTLCSLTYLSSHKTFSSIGRVKNITRGNQTNMDGGIFGYGGSGGNISTANVDTSVDQQVQMTMAMGNTAETCTFQGIRAIVYPAM